MSKLKPCPFCGSKAIINIIPPHTHKIATFMPDYGGGAFVECTNCSCGIAASNRAEAVEAWNTRVDTTIRKGHDGK